MNIAPQVHNYNWEMPLNGVYGQGMVMCWDKQEVKKWAETL